MKLTVLQPDQRQFFDDNGYLVVPGALTATEVESLTQISDRMIGQCDRAENQYYVQLAPASSKSPPSIRCLRTTQRCRWWCAIIAQYPPTYDGHHLQVPESEAAEPSRGVSRYWHDPGSGHPHCARRNQGRLLLNRLSRASVGFTLFAPGCTNCRRLYPYQKVASTPKTSLICVSMWAMPFF